MKRRISTLDLAAYNEGRLTAAERGRVEGALAGDEAAMDELLSLHRVVACARDAERAPARVVSGAIELYPHRAGGFDLVLGLAGEKLRVLRHAVGIGLSFPQAAVALRGGRPGMPLLKISKECGNISALLYIERTGPATCSIRVQVGGDEGDDDGRLMAEVLRGKRVVASEALGPLQAVFDTMGAGDYAVRLRRGRTVLGSVAIRIKELQGGDDD